MKPIPEISDELKHAQSTFKQQKSTLATDTADQDMINDDIETFLKKWKMKKDKNKKIEKIKKDDNFNERCIINHATLTKDQAINSKFKDTISLQSH
jgi:predicted Holliday junction resolvase-like endonuclease